MPDNKSKNIERKGPEKIIDIAELFPLFDNEIISSMTKTTPGLSLRELAD